MQKHEASWEDIYEMTRKIVNTQFHNIERFQGEEKEDLVQEVVMKAYKGWESFKGDCQVESWIYNIVKNSIINIGIKHQREKRKSLGTYSIEYNEMDFEDEESMGLEEEYDFNKKILKLNNILEQDFSIDEQKVFRGMLKGYSATKIGDVFDLNYVWVKEVIERLKGVVV